MGTKRVFVSKMMSEQVFASRVRFYVSNEFLAVFAGELLPASTRSRVVLDILRQWDGELRSIPEQWRGSVELRLTLKESDLAAMYKAEQAGLCRREWLLQAFACHAQRRSRAVHLTSADENEKASSAANRSVRPDDDELTDERLQFLRDALVQMKSELIEQIRSLGAHGHGYTGGDEVDIATARQDQMNRHKLIERARQQLNEINAAIQRMQNGEYGYCEETGEPIGWRRLQANPTARLCLDAQQRREYLRRSLAAA